MTYKLRGYSIALRVAIALTAAVGAVTLPQSADSQSVPLVSLTPTNPLKTEYESASKATILLVVSSDFPAVAVKFLTQSMAKDGIGIATSVSPSLPSKLASLYIDGRLMELKMHNQPASVHIGFADMGRTASAIKFYIQDNKLQLKRPAESAQ